MRRQFTLILLLLISSSLFCFAVPPQRPIADPAAPDQSELLKVSKDPDFIVRNFKTMYVNAEDAKFFGSDQLKAALAGKGVGPFSGIAGAASIASEFVSMAKPYRIASQQKPK